MQPSWQKQQSSLDVLQSMINGVLIETGKALRSANVKGVKTIGYTHDRLQSLLPSTIDKFHLALDSLESDIVRAKAVLDRDLRELQARREALERPVIDEDSPNLPANTSDMQNTPSPHALMDLQYESISEHESKDTVMNNSVETTGISSPEAKVESSPIAHSPNQVTQKDQAEVQSHEHRETSMQQIKAEGFEMQGDVQQVTEDATNKSAAHGLSLDLSVTVPSAASEALIASGLQSSTLGSMFDTGNHGDLDLNFNFDFTTDANDNQNLDFGGGNGDLDLSSFGGETNNNQENVESILQDFDGYGNGDNSDFILGLSNDPNNQDDDQGGNPTTDDFGMSGGDLDMAMGMESNFDEMVDDMGYGDANDDGSQFDMYLAYGNT